MTTVRAFYDDEKREGCRNASMGMHNELVKVMKYPNMVIVA